VAEM